MAAVNVIAASTEVVLRGGGTAAVGVGGRGTAADGIAVAVRTAAALIR